MILQDLFLQLVLCRDEIHQHVCAPSAHHDETLAIEVETRQVCPVIQSVLPLFCMYQIQLTSISRSQTQFMMSVSNLDVPCSMRTSAHSTTVRDISYI